MSVAVANKFADDVLSSKTNIPRKVILQKRCIKCGESEKEFYASLIENKDYRCCDCIVEINKNRKPWMKTLSNIKRRCSHQKTYVERGIKCFITAQELKDLWERDKAEEMYWPSIDRIDGNGHYEKTNLRYIEFRQNCTQSKTLRSKNVTTNNSK